MATPNITQLADDLQRLSESLGSIRQQLDDRSIAAIPVYQDVNAGYTLLSAYLVFFMQAGFAMLSAGSVRSKNSKNIILLNLLDACFGCLAWYATGFAFAFGDPDMLADGSFEWRGNPFIGHRFFFHAGLARTSYATWFFQFTFAATSATIVSGAVAERCKFECYVFYNLMLVSFVYPVVAHWVWSPWGWMSALRTPATASSGYTLLFNCGVYDFAGDGPVHMVGGFASLVAAWVLGARIGRFDAAGHPVDMPGHNASLTLLGVFLLWFGWYGFNPGSTNAILGPWVGYSSISAAIAVNTTISAAGATISTLLISMLHQYMSLGVVVWDLIIAGNGALVGLVAITGGCAFVQTWAALVIGLIAGAVYYALSKLILHKLRIDDPLDAIAVHAGGGMWGMLGCAAFAAPNMVTDWYGPHPGSVVVAGGAGGGVTATSREFGFIMGGSGNLLAAHLLYIIVIFCWVCVTMTPFFVLLNKLGLMRVPPDVEVMGLDISYHGGSSYPHDGGHNAVNGSVGGSDAYMTRDQVERLLEGAMVGLERRLLTQNPELALCSVLLDGSSKGAGGKDPELGQQLKMVRSLQPLAERQSLEAAAAADAAAEAYLEADDKIERGEGGGAAPGGGSGTTAEFGGGSMHNGSAGGGSMHNGGGGGSMHNGSAGGGSMHNGGGGSSMHSGRGGLSHLQQRIHRAYNGTESQEGSRHSHVKWADAQPAQPGSDQASGVP